MRSLRSNSQNELSLCNIKALIDSAKNEVIGSMKVEIQSLRESISSLTSRVDKLEIENTSLKAQFQQALNQPNANSGSFESACSEMMNEMQQRDRRKLNLIVFGASEPSTGTVTERKVADREKCSEIFEAIGLPNCCIKEVSRLGKLSDERSRLLRVTVANEDDKRFIISHSKQLRQTEMFKNVYVKPDLTLYQRKIDFQLRKELHAKKSAHPETDFMIYRGKVTERNNPQGFRKAF